MSSLNIKVFKLFWFKLLFYLKNNVPACSLYIYEAVMKTTRLHALNVFIFCSVNADDCVCYCLHFGIVDHAEFKSFNLLLLTCLRTYKLLYSCLTSKGGMTSQNDARGNRLLSQQKIRILK